MKDNDRVISHESYQSHNIHIYIYIYIYIYISYLAEFFLQWGIFQTKLLEKIKIHILCSIFFLKNRAVCEIMWRNIVEPDRLQMTTLRMRIACWILKATNTHSEYVILTYFPQQHLITNTPHCYVILHCLYCFIIEQFDMFCCCVFVCLELLLIAVLMNNLAIKNVITWAILSKSAKPTHAQLPTVTSPLAC